MNMLGSPPDLRQASGSAQPGHGALIMVVASPGSGRRHFVRSSPATWRASVGSS
jgi:hypothetical protein